MKTNDVLRGLLGFVSILTVGASVLACGAPAEGEGESATSQGQAVTAGSDGAKFACGTTSCTAETQYCEHIVGGRFGASSYSCVAVPAQCASNVTCGCVARLPRTCSGSDGELTVTVLAP